MRGGNGLPQFSETAELHCLDYRIWRRDYTNVINQLDRYKMTKRTNSRSTAYRTLRHLLLPTMFGR